MLKPFRVERFDGLNLRADPLEVGPEGCVACLDMELSPARFALPRPGFEVRSSLANIAAGSYAFLYALPDVNRVLAVTSLGVVFVYDNAGAQVSTDVTGSSTSTFSYSAVNASDGTYVANGDGARFINSSGAISEPSFTGHTPIGACMAMTPVDGRLVVNDGSDRVRFSNEFDPLTFNTDDWVDLAPDDTESIRAIVTWRDLVFFFKRTKAWVYYGTGTDPDGAPVFNIRPIANIPALDYAGSPVAVGRNGVYYLSRTGVYVTTGDTPRKISGVLDPLFTTIPDALGNPVIPGKPAGTSSSRPVTHWWADRLYVAYPTGVGVGNDRLLVWDEALDAWTMWKQDPGIAAMCSQPVGSTTSTQATLLVGTSEFDAPFGADTLSSIKSLTDSTTYLDESQTTSSLTSTAFPWSRTSGFYDLGSPMEKKIRYTDLYGTGSVTVQLLTQGGRSADVADPGTAVTLGTAPAVSRTRRTRSARGRVFAHKLSGTGPAMVSRLEHWHLPPGRQA